MDGDEEDWKEWKRTDTEEDNVFILLFVLSLHPRWLRYTINLLVWEDFGPYFFQHRSPRRSRILGNLDNFIHSYFGLDYRSLRSEASNIPLHRIPDESHSLLLKAQ